MNLAPESGLRWLIGAVAMVTATGVVALLLRLGPRLPHDRPGHRSLHARPVPRVGGLAIWTGVLVALGVTAPAVLVPAAWVVAWAAVAVVSAVDDWYGVRPGVRLAVQALAAAIAAAAIFGPDAAGASPWQAVAVGTVAAVAIAWAANLYNFMDGSDGLAAAMAVVGFGAYAVAEVGGGGSGALPLAVAAAVLPFLAVNAPPARMFMGDVGAVPLGFLAATIGLAGWRAGHWPTWFPVLVFLPFIADATTTLVRRLWRRERVWEAHRSHYYQRLHQLGAGHRGTLLLYGCLALATAGSAVVVLAMAPAAGPAALAVWIGAFAAFFAAIDYHWSRRTTDSR
jgi:UDP-N-acetylmuramyl pentapeptide phosphotransferase/UDP-N-acetylglucosamine-1-phosphate transferase